MVAARREFQKLMSSRERRRAEMVARVKAAARTCRKRVDMARRHRFKPLGGANRR